MSSPNLNNLIIIGCILIYVAGVLFGLETGSRNVVCQVSRDQHVYKGTIHHKNLANSFSVYGSHLLLSALKKSYICTENEMVWNYSTKYRRI